MSAGIPARPRDPGVPEKLKGAKVHRTFAPLLLDGISRLKRDDQPKSGMPPQGKLEGALAKADSPESGEPRRRRNVWNGVEKQTNDLVAISVTSLCLCLKDHSVVRKLVGD